MKLPQVQDCFDNVLRMLKKVEEAEQARTAQRDRLAEGMEYWQKRAGEAEVKLQALGENGASKADVLLST